MMAGASAAVATNGAKSEIKATQSPKIASTVPCLSGGKLATFAELNDFSDMIFIYSTVTMDIRALLFKVSSAPNGQAILFTKDVQNAPFSALPQIPRSIAQNAGKPRSHSLNQTSHLIEAGQRRIQENLEL